MKSRLTIAFIYVSFIGLSQTSMSLDTLLDIQFSKFIDEYSIYSSDSNNIQEYGVLGDIDSQCELRVAHNRIVKQGYRLAWIHTHQADHSFLTHFSKIDSIRLYPLCDSTGFSQVSLPMFEWGGGSYSIGSKYIVFYSDLPTGTANDIRYYYIKED